MTVLIKQITDYFCDVNCIITFKCGTVCFLQPGWKNKMKQKLADIEFILLKDMWPSWT